MPDEVARRGAHEVADRLELAALLRATSLSGAALAGIAGEVGLDHHDVALGVRTMSRRAEMLGDAYPFRLAGGGVAAVAGAQATPWTALLLCTPALRARTGIPVQDAAHRVEQVTATALASFYGHGTNVVRFAWPSEDGRPAEFPDAVRWLAERMGVPVGAAYRPPYRRDGGVDVVAWRPFADRRSGFPVLLAQCTVETDFEHKAGDVDVRVWAGWLRLDVDPMIALAIPSVVPDGERWNHLAARTVVLDRLRLAGLLAGSTGDGRLADVLRWAGGELDRMRREL